MTQPNPGELWGVAGKPETYRFVVRVSSRVCWNGVYDDGLDGPEAWTRYLTTTGATRLYPPKESELPPC